MASCPCRLVGIMTCFGSVMLAGPPSSAAGLRRSSSRPAAKAVIAARACRLWLVAGPSGAGLVPAPRRTLAAPRAADRGAGRGEIGRPLWRAGLPRQQRRVRRRRGQLSARPGYNRATFVQQGEGQRGIIALQPNSCYGTESEQDRQTNPSTDIGWRVLQPEIHRQLPWTVEVRIA
jgi:hypothetical protein